jgi:sugar lactone lactonase YvrE
LETQAGFPNAQDDSGGSKPNIAGGTCTNGDLFANGITTNATGAGPFFAVDGGAGGSNQTQLKLQPCGTSGFQTSPTQGINTYFPNDQIQGTYLGGGSAGAQEPSGGNHPPYFAYITGTTYTMFTTGVPAQNNWVSPPATSSAYAHPYPLSPTPGCGVTSGCTFVDAAARQLLSARRPEVIFGNQVNIAVAPLFAQTYHGAVGAGESDSAANGHAILALNGPGDSGRVFADQVVAPSFGTNGNGGNLGNSYAATASSGCSGTVNGMPQVAATISIPGIGTGSATFFGAQWIVTAGNLPSNGSGAPTTSCVITLSDGVNSVPVWISNSVAGGGATIIIGAIPPRLFVADQAGNNVQIYNSPFTGSPSPSVTVSSGLNGPAGVAFDSGGSLYVANINSNTVQIYTQPFSGASSPSATISTGLNQPVFLAFDAGGKLYVANYAGQTVTIYNPPFSGASSPSATISAGLSDPNGVAFDSGGNLYVSNQLGSTVQIYTPPFSGASSPSTTISTGLNIPLGLAFDSSGNLYVANAIGSTVPIYHPPFSGASSPSATISTGANGPNGLAFDAGGNLYVAITSNNTVQIYNPPFSGSSSPSATITSGLNAPYGLAFH